MTLTQKIEAYMDKHSKFGTTVSDGDLALIAKLHIEEAVRKAHQEYWARAMNEDMPLEAIINAIKDC